MTSTKSTAKTIADHIASEALGQGLSVEGLRAYDLTTADCDYIRAEAPAADYPAEAFSADEWRVLFAEVERAVREYA